ncbi:MAG: glycosyltransferase [Pelosinus sp.]|nr:glycosyltransferase [Pelosinus sp.]
MKILLLADSSSSHTVKWARSLSRQGITIAIFSLNYCDRMLYSQYPNIQLFIQTFSKDVIRGKEGAYAKWQYVKSLNALKHVIYEYQPDIIHAHYASSYGLLGALSGFRPFIISVWGSDVFDFPNISILHKLILKFNLSKADKILSTSHVMVKETNKYTNKLIEVTPFGIDLDVFKPQSGNTLFNKDDIVIGTVKALDEKYGIEYLVRSFAILKGKYKNISLKLLIVGGGAQETYLKELVQVLNIEEDTVFTGKVLYDDVPVYHNMINISVFLSNSESFGVAIIEASACAKPVVVSNIGGLPEVVEGGVTGLIVEPRNLDQTVIAIETLILDEKLRIKMGQAGRKRVEGLFNWQQNVKQMINIYRKVLNEL